MIKIKNFSNKITILRFFITPVFVFFIMQQWFLIANIIFIIGAVSDLVDGYVARLQNNTTLFGKAMDTVVDKFFICSSLVALTTIPMFQVSVITIIIVMAREFIILGLRMCGLSKGVSIDVDKYGKWKMGFQITTIIVILLCLIFYSHFPVFMSPFQIYCTYLIHVLTFIMIFITILSGVSYCRKYWYVFQNDL